MTPQLNGTQFRDVLTAMKTLGGEVLPLNELAFGANKALTGLDLPPLALAVWMATLSQESAGFVYLEEIDKTGSYKPYWGRSFVQVTWKANYSQFGAWCVRRGEIVTPSLFVDKPDRLKELHWAWLGGVWFFEANSLWDDAKAGDFQFVETTVNLGTGSHTRYPAGWSARLAWFRAWCKVLLNPPALTINGELDEATSRRLQTWVGVRADGTVGKVTYSGIQAWLGRTADGTLSTADVEAFQNKIGAYVDGDWGPGTTKDLQRYLNEYT